MAVKIALITISSLFRSKMAAHLSGGRGITMACRRAVIMTARGIAKSVSAQLPNIHSLPNSGRIRRQIRRLRGQQ
jgi:hypothetical protein